MPYRTDEAQSLGLSPFFSNVALWIAIPILVMLGLGSRCVNGAPTGPSPSEMRDECFDTCWVSETGLDDPICVDACIDKFPPFL